MNGDDFVQLLSRSRDVSECLDPGLPLTLSRAPGRLDVMGGIADYSGSLVLEMPTAEATWAAAQPRSDGAIHLLVLDPSNGTVTRRARFDVEAFVTGPGSRAVTAREWFRQGPAEQRWTAYVAGTLTILVEEHDLDPRRGLTLCIASEVPEGLGVSSSAAVEVASMQAISVAFGLTLDPEALAAACQRVENLVVGAACGVMDQMTSACGDSSALLVLSCQPANLLGTLPLPSDLGLWGVDSGIRHAVLGNDYTRVRVATFMGHRILAHLRGLAARPTEREGCVQIEDPEWHGYLANLAPSLYLQRYRDHVPELLGGAAFLQRYQGTVDEVTRVDPHVEYHVRRAVEHAVFEHHRVGLFQHLLSGSQSAATRPLLGELMYQSHASYSACGLGSTGTDLLVDLVRHSAASTGLYGAKISGGGSGGTVVILARADAESQVRQLASRYQRSTGHTPHLFVGSSQGAGKFGTVQALSTRGSWRVHAADS